MRCVWVAVSTVVAVVLLGTGSTAWAHHTPAPQPTEPGTWVPRQWACHEQQAAPALDNSRTATTSCDVTAWTLSTVPAPTSTDAPPLEQVQVVGPVVVQPDPATVPFPVAAPAPLPVVEQSPASNEPVQLDCASPSPSPTSEPSPSPPLDGSTSPEPSPSPSPSQSPAVSPGCYMTTTTTLDSTQWITAGLFASVALLLGLIGFVRREAVGLTT